MSSEETTRLAPTSNLPSSTLVARPVGTSSTHPQKLNGGRGVNSALSPFPKTGWTAPVDTLVSSIETKSVTSKWQKMDSVSRGEPRGKKRTGCKQFPNHRVKLYLCARDHRSTGLSRRYFFDSTSVSPNDPLPRPQSTIRPDPALGPVRPTLRPTTVPSSFTSTWVVYT